MNICIVGYGSIGKRHHCVLKSILRNDAIFTVIDLDTQAKIKDVCQDAFDILVICTPTSSHLDVASKFSNIKKLIFIEKPLDASIKKIGNYRNKIDISKVHVWCNLRFTEPYEKIKKSARKARLINVTSMSYLPCWRPKSNHLESYSANKSLGGGVILDFIHEPDYISSIFGLPDNSKQIERKIFNGITHDTNDSALILWEYEDKLINFCFSYGSKTFKRFIEIIDDECETERIEITREDIETSYEKQWRYIIKNGPSNTYDQAASLQAVLQS